MTDSSFAFQPHNSSIQFGGQFGTAQHQNSVSMMHSMSVDEESSQLHGQQQSQHWEHKDLRKNAYNQQYAKQDGVDGGLSEEKAVVASGWIPSIESKPSGHKKN